MGKTHVTIADIARETGFSIMTVSRAFNNHKKVSPKTLDKILKKAEELDFHPNRVARSLALKCTNIIHVYIPKELSATEPFVAQTVAAIGERLGENGYSFLLSRNLPHKVTCDGVIVMGVNKETEDKLSTFQIEKPVVLFGNHENVPAWVDVDNYQGQKIAVKYLFEKGGKNIAYLSAPLYMNYAKERLQGYKDVMAELQMGEIAIECSDNNVSAGYEGAKKLLASNLPIDGIVCATDPIAIGCTYALKEMGLEIPRDVSVVGFDGFGYENMTSPHLTTIKQPLYEVGVCLADTILAILNGQQPIRSKISPKLVINESA
ncbi:MAG: LacI family DNA-binding transcriptional regulator [Clostridia bacterium]|nr:LacI family DNA-binding transcriptional regulator [Clostridia bacterium]